MPGRKITEKYHFLLLAEAAVDDVSRRFNPIKYTADGG
jgi:hypothetical protein